MIPTTMRKSGATGLVFLLSSAVLVFVTAADGYDPLYHDNLTEALHSMETDGDVILGFFRAGSYWRTDSLGHSELHDYQQGLSVVRLLFLGRYGLTNSHTVSLLVPAFLLLRGPGDSTGAGIVDPWISLDGWLTREPRVFARGAIRLPLKGALESGDYSESDRHLALDGAVTVVSPLSAGSGITVEGTAGLRYYTSAWDGLYETPRDSAETKPPLELRFTGFLVLPVNPELSLRVGGDFAGRGETQALINGDWTGQDNSAFSRKDLRTGFSLNNERLNLAVDVYYRFAGENDDKEWGLMVSGTGLNIKDLFSGSGGR